MNTSTMARWIAGVGALGVLATAVASAHGFVLEGGPAPLLRHAAGGLVACLLALFAQAWFAFFLTGSLLVPGAGAKRFPEQRRALRRATVRATLASLIAVGVTMAAFVLGVFTFAREVPGAWHAGVAIGAIAVQIVALWLALRSVASVEAALRVIEGDA